MIVDSFVIEETVVNIHDDFVPKNTDDYNKRIVEIYDSINKIKMNCEKKDIDISDWFYKKNEIKRIEG